jgi:Putative adhesin
MTDPDTAHDIPRRGVLVTTASGTIHRTFPVTGTLSVDCRVGLGSITVHARDALTEATVTVAPRDAASDVAERTEIDLHGSTLVVRAPKLAGVFDLFGGRMSRSALDIDIDVPSGSGLKVVSYGADVVVEGRSGSADIASGSTRTQLDVVDGDLRLRYGSGPARVTRVTGSAVIKSGSGDARLDEVGERLVMACGSGNLNVGIAHGPVSMRAGSGRATIGTAEADVDLVTGSGALSVGLRAGQTARLDVTTGSGDLRSDLPVEGTQPTGAPAITIRARTGSGDVRIVRAS